MYETEGKRKKESELINSIKSTYIILESVIYEIVLILLLLSTNY